MPNLLLSSSHQILLVQPDPTLAESLSSDLKASGYNPVLTATPASCLAQMVQMQPSLVVVDEQLGEQSGLELCCRLRAAGTRVPLLVMLNRDSLADRIACLDAGADDYFLKPYRPELFLQLIQLYLQPYVEVGEELRFENLALDLVNRRAERDGRRIDLTMKEFELLKYLMEHPGQVLNREQILENVWGYDFVGESNVIEVYIRYLRLKVEEEGEKRLIHTVRGVGYVLRET